MTLIQNVRSYRIARLLALSISLLVFGVGCSSGNGDLRGVEPPPTPILSIRDRYAVVSGAYVRVYERADTSSELRFHVRNGDVVEVLSKTNYQVELRNARSYWYQIRRGDQSGWVFGDDINLYASRERAINASQTRGTETAPDSDGTE